MGHDQRHRGGCVAQLGDSRAVEKRPQNRPLFANWHGQESDVSPYDAANGMSLVGPNVAPNGTYTFRADGDQDVEQAPEGTTANVWDYENQRTEVLLPSGQRETITYNADFRMKRRRV